MNISTFRCVVPVVALAFALGACTQSSSSPSTPVAPKPKVEPKPTPPSKVDDSAKGPNGLMSVTDGTALSDDRKAIDALVARADQEGKKLVLVVSAAWCGPCTEFTNDITVHPEYIKELHDNGYILAKAEFEKMVVGGGSDFLTLNDYLPANVNFFPTFYLYSKGQWLSIGSPNDYKSLKGTLDSNPQQPLSYADVTAIIADKAAPDAQKARLYQALYGNFTGIYSYTEAKGVIDALRKSGSQDYGSLADFLKQFMWSYVGNGALDIASFTKDFPDQGPTLTDLSSDDFNIQPFTYLLKASWTKNGVKATAAKCDAMWSDYRKNFVAGKNTDADFKTKLAKYDFIMKTTCLHLQATAAGSLTPDLKAQVDALDKSQIKDWGLLVMDGETQKALDVYHARYQHYVDYYNKTLPDIQSQLDKAKASGDQAAIDAAQHELDVENFRVQYHAQVDADAEAEIKAGATVTSVHEIQ